MRVAFDSRPASDPRGIGRYARCLLEALRATAGDDVIVETHRPRAAPTSSTRRGSTACACAAGCPQVVTLHDLVPLKRRSEYLRTGARFRLRYMSVQRAERVIVPTEAVAGDAVARLGIRRDAIVVIPEAAAPAMWPRSQQEVDAVRAPVRAARRVPAVGRRPGAPRPAQARRRARRTPRELPLVLVGPVKQWARELPGVTLTGHVSDDDLAAIYTGAHALVFPSDDEGFGLPTVEALACGTPVVACDVPALREVLGDRATFVASEDLTGLIGAAQSAHAARAGAAGVDVGGRRAGDLGGLRRRRGGRLRRPRLRARSDRRTFAGNRGGALMQTFVILRRHGWRSPADLEEAAGRSTRVGDEEMTDDIRWIRSYALDEGDGSVGTVCIYQASSEDAIREHARRADLPVDEVVRVADTVLVRPDP